MSKRKASCTLDVFPPLSSYRRHFDPFTAFTQDEPPLRKRAPPKFPQPLYKASVKKLAEIGTNKLHSSTADIDSAILVRIKKCLDRANHPGTPELEAKTALCMASRLMGQYSVSQAELLRADGDWSNPVKNQAYVDTLCCAMTTFFDCKYYSTGHHSSLVFTFYGIAENTVAAALAFEMIYNLICEWARPYKGTGPRNSYSHGVCDEMHRMATQKEEDELAEAANAEEGATAAKVRQEEAERQSQLDRLHPYPLGPSGSSFLEAAHVSDSDDIGNNHNPSQENASGLLLLGYDRVDPNSLDDNEGSEADGYIGDDYIEPDFKIEDEDSDTFWSREDETGNSTKIVTLASNTVPGLNPTLLAKNATSTTDSDPLDLKSPVPASNVKKEVAGASTNSDLKLENKWASSVQLQLFRQTASKIADEHLQECGIKLSSAGRSRQTVIRDQYAYNQGVKDSKKIDIHGKRITESADSDV
ncbi:hypothetical protein V493_08418 [Pseudogymnoascus sp. VKM F-4281 (FW-2241)]|nr:hypothetical protein V493_08418 [Pseudogymnoascus sp. VKM F-4281 (FW-2241)]